MKRNICKFLVFVQIFSLMCTMSLSVNADTPLNINNVTENTQNKAYVDFNGAIYCDYANEMTKYRSNMYKSFSKVSVEKNTQTFDSGLYKVNTNNAVGTTEAEKVRSLDGAYALFKNESFDLTGFCVWMYQKEYNEDLFCNVYISDTGKKYRLLNPEDGKYEITVNYIASDDIYEIVFYSDYLEKGTNYLKIEFSKNCSTLSEVSNTQIGMAVVECADVNELPAPPVRFTNNVYTDECTATTNSAYVKYNNIGIESVSDNASIMKRRGESVWLRRKNATVSDSSITYTCPDNGEITDIAIWFGRHDNENINMSVSVSEDGDTFRSIGTVNAENITIYPELISPSDTTGGWVCSMGSISNLPSDTKYLRLELPETYTNWWGLNILKVQFGYNSNTLEKDTSKTETYPAPENAKLSDAYSVKVRTPNENNWTELDTYKTQLRIDNGKEFTEGYDTASKNSALSYFDFNGTVEVAVSRIDKDVNDFSILPAAHNIDFTKEDNTVYFTLTQPTKLIVQCDGDKYDVLHLFANPIETDKPNPLDKNVIYFEAGYYDYLNTGGILKACDTDTDYPYAELRVPSNTTVYIEGGAVVNAHITIANAHNVKICGRGIVSQLDMNTPDGNHAWPWQHWGIRITDSSDITIKDIIMNNADWYSIYGGASNNITIDNFKAISSMEWSDGIDMMSCSNVIINDCFLRNGDDCIAVYADRMGHSGNALNWTITNNVLVADISRAINIGGHGSQDAENRRLIQNIKCENNKVISNRSTSSKEYAGTLSVKVGEENITRNVVFKNITIEGIGNESILSVRAMGNKAYSDSYGYRAENILFENIYSDNYGTLSSEIYGINEFLQTPRMVSGVTVKNLYISGNLQKTFDEADIVFDDNLFLQSVEDIYLIAVDEDADNVSITYDVKNRKNRQPMFIAAKYDKNVLTGTECVSFKNNIGEIKDIQKPFELFTFDKNTMVPYLSKQTIK